jgi:hypothetical protein
MKTKNSYKQRLWFLFIGGVAFILICYNLGFKKTIDEMNSAKEYNRQLDALQDAPIQLRILEKRRKEFDDNPGNNYQIKDNVEVLLLEKVTSLIKDLKLKITELPKNDISPKDGYTVKTQQLVLQGSFIDLLTFLHSIEKDHSIGNICSVDFYSQKNARTGTFTLKMKIYFQTIIQTNSNE